MPRIAVVLNPNSRKNRRADHEGVLREILGPHGEVFVTPGVDALEPLARRLVDEGVEHVVSDGGDGALHWALNTLWPIASERGVALPAFLPTNGGTIDFVARKAGVRGRSVVLVERLVARVAKGERVPRLPLDSLAITLRRGDVEQRRLGFALAAAGIGQRFFDKYYALPDPGAPAIAWVIARAVASLGASVIPVAGRSLGAYARSMFAPFEARVRIDGEEVPAALHGAVHAGAFDVDLGGVVRVFPLAKEPGVLHFRAGDISPVRIVMNLPALVRGGAIRAPHMRDTSGRVMEIEATGAERLRPVIDGEIYEGVDTMRVELGPRIEITRP